MCQDTNVIWSNGLNIDRTADPFKINPVALARWTQGKLQNLSQGKLAKLLGNTPTTISRWKQGGVLTLHREPLEAIAALDHVSFEQVLVWFAPEETELDVVKMDVGSDRLTKLEQEVRLLTMDNRLLKLELGSLREFIELLGRDVNELRGMVSGKDSA